MSQFVNVLMSTYNGERYIRQQINSIYAQKDVRVKLHVRDDGSKDGTMDIIRSYAKQRSIRITTDGRNLGPARSFMAMLADSDSDADYYAFSDQDDYWMEDKLSSAVKMLRGDDEVPALYFSQTQLTDASLNPIDSVIINPRMTYGESLVYEFIGGCTMVMNKRLRDIVNTYVPEYIPMHDVWIYSVALAVGAKICFDPVPHILYRQHGNNTVGQGCALNEWKRRMNRIVGREQSRYRRACELEKGYLQMMPEYNRRLTKMFVNSKTSLAKRAQLLLADDYRCSDNRTWLLFKIAVMLNQY